MEKEIIEGINITDRLVLDKTDENFNVYPNIDAKYGPYSSVEEALSILLKRVRSKGLTIGITKEDNTIVEYWFRNGIEDEDLVEKALSIDFKDVISGIEDTVFPLEWESFNPGETTIELGKTIVPRISWTLKCKNEFITPDRVSVTTNGVSVGEVSSDKLSWDRKAELSVSTDYDIKVFYGNRTLSRRQSYTFCLKKYYGVTNKEVLTEADILALHNKDWAFDCGLPSTYFDCSGGKYPVYVVPNNIYNDYINKIGAIKLYVGGFKTTDLDIKNIDITNSFGFRDSYTIIRLKTIQTGILNIEVK